MLYLFSGICSPNPVIYNDECVQKILQRYLMIEYYGYLHNWKSDPSVLALISVITGKAHMTRSSFLSRDGRIIANSYLLWHTRLSIILRHFSSHGFAIANRLAVLVILL